MDRSTYYSLGSSVTKRCTSCRSSFTTEDDKGLACQILFAQEDALPTFVADTVKYKGEPSPGTAGTKTLRLEHTKL